MNSLLNIINYNEVTIRCITVAYCRVNGECVAIGHGDDRERGTADQ